MSFEYAVRPFQSTDPHGRVRIPSAPEGTAQRATLTWGATAAVDRMDNKGISVTTHWPDDAATGCCTEKLAETTRKSTQVRVNDSHDAANWILVNRATELSLDKDHQSSCDNLDVWYNTQMNASPASVLANYDREAAQMGVRKPEPDKCKTTMKLNANTANAV